MSRNARDAVAKNGQALGIMCVLTLEAPQRGGLVLSIPEELGKTVE